MNCCWLCGRPIQDPPEIIGHYRAGRCSLAHRGCLRVLGELELDLRADHAGRGPTHERPRPA